MIEFSTNNLDEREVPSSNIENENCTENEHQDLTDGTANLPVLDFTNENGNVRVKVRRILRDEMLGQLDAVFASHPHTKQKNVNGGFSLCLGVDRLTGNKVWAHIELTVNAKDPNIDSWSGRPKNSTAIFEVPKLFE